MSIRPFVIGLVLAAPLLTQAAQSIDQSTLSCTQSLVDNRASSLTFSCEGDLNITGGTWTTDSLISLSATGSMVLQGITFNTPSLSLKAQNIVFDSVVNLPKDGVLYMEAVTGGVQITDGAKIYFDGQIPTLKGGDVRLIGGDVRLVGAIPEPESYALALAALATGAALARRRKA